MTSGNMATEVRSELRKKKNQKKKNQSLVKINTAITVCAVLGRNEDGKTFQRPDTIPSITLR